ncbi:hypothetical protein [Streptomyces sp. NPDC088196]|uniref:hypothetical protein n=1 Tax=Streptomyces sp. NPDC088196 TaxID=3154868 RepID=UPI00344F4416
MTAVKSWAAQNQRVHNLPVADLHTYFVVAGGTPVLVHHSGCSIGFTGDTLSDAFTDINKGGGHAIRHLIKDGLIPDKGSVASQFKYFEDNFSQVQGLLPHGLDELGAVLLDTDVYGRGVGLGQGGGDVVPHALDDLRQFEPDGLDVVGYSLDHVAGPGDLREVGVRLVLAAHLPRPGEDLPVMPVHQGPEKAGDGGHQEGAGHHAVIRSGMERERGG